MALEDKYVKVASDAKAEEFKAIGERAQRGEVKWAYYTIENDKGFHYYQIIKK